ncbi:nucleotidyltransferase family protein [Thermosipho ferrireducens]|uniref:Nucleotidyltransferase family protein n=1 Tax=Thermosipho ferrireducens TaxID=2571116 RepID=A0ABX7S6L5_9BACT|nr:nucleotidyltransferase family protein [Thermosipho ferrireducens]QTA38231.1 nucleotidyltransferase family protein [Thermosipho ferrireducens]
MKENVKSLEEIIQILIQHREYLEEKYRIKSLKIFGSYAEGKQTEKSDIDLIVDFYEVPTLIEFVRIEEELSKILGVKVDLLTEKSISPFIKPYIKEVEVI